MLTASIAWVVADAYCPRAFGLALADLGFGRESFRFRGRDQRPSLHRWNCLGAREAIVWILAILGFSTFAAVVARLFIGRAGVGRDLRGWGLFVALVAAWLAAWVSSDSLRWLGVRVRTRAQLDWYEATVEPLLPGWPGGSVNLRGGLYHQGGWRGEEYLWATRNGSYHFLGDPARYIYRRRAGGFLLAMRPEENCLVLYSPEPPTTEPLVGTDFRSRKVIDFVHLRGPWYVMRFR